MNRNKAGKMLAPYVKAIFSFSLKRCKNAKDAEDLSQEIILKAFCALLKTEVRDLEKFLWSIAHNALANYYRDSARRVGVSIEDMELSLSTDVEKDLLTKESVEALRKEIAYLSKTQRQIILLYYYENRGQKEIAERLNISLSLVKWHLFDAKQNLKRGINSMRTNEHLQFNPIQFSLMGFNGSAGSMGGTQAFFRGALSQNIAYSVYREAKTVNEIAKALGVSPVYIESEAEFLEEYGYLIKKGDKYIANLLIQEFEGEGEEISRLHEKSYAGAAKLFANRLYDELVNSGILQSDKIECVYKRDENYLLWALLPYITANCGNVEGEIAFEDVATRRPDGGYDIANVTVKSPEDKQPKYYESLLKWCGPSWTSHKNCTLWSCRSEWTAERGAQACWEYLSDRTATLLSRVCNGETLSVDEYVFLAEQGFIRMEKGKPRLQAIWLKDREIRAKLLQIGGKVKGDCQKELDAFKRPFVKAVLDFTPKHLRKMQAFGLQYTFGADGWFLLYCIKELIDSGKLKLPTERQQSSLMMVIATE